MMKTIFYILLIAAIGGLIVACAKTSRNEVSTNASGSANSNSNKGRLDEPGDEAKKAPNSAERETQKPVNESKNSQNPSAKTSFELRCGWFSNPTPANAWLEDRDGEWIIGTQGGHQAEGDYPEFKDEEWVKTNINYGYGCACIRAKVDFKTRYVLEIESSYSQPLSVCRKDRALKEPKD